MEFRLQEIRNQDETVNRRKSHVQAAETSDDREVESLGQSLFGFQLKEGAK